MTATHPTRRTSTGPTTAARPFRGAAGAPTWLWVWGLQCWLVWVAGPRAYRGALTTLDAAWSLLPLAVLAGLWGLHRRGHSLRPALTLGLYPVSLALAVTDLEPQMALATYAPPVLLVGSLSLLVFAATASQLATQPTRLRAGAVQPLGESHLTVTDPRRARWQRALLLFSSASLLGLVVFGSWDTALRYHEAWGESAAAGATLNAITAGLIGCVAMAAVVGPSLRAERVGPGSHQWLGRRRRVIWLLAVAISGAVAYGLMRAST